MASGNAIAPITDEADDGLYGPERIPSKDRRSKLIRSKEKYAGHIINACPFGCRDEQLDEQMYCKHLIGFTDMADSEVFYPMVNRPALVKDGKVIGSKRHRFVDGDDPKELMPGDKIVTISVSHRVYRNVDKKPKE